MAKRKPPKRLSPHKIDRLLAAQKPLKTDIQIVQQGLRNPEAGTSQTNKTFRATAKNYDVLKADEAFKNFIAFLQKVKSRYDENKARLADAEAQESDLHHCMELTENLTEKERKLIFSKLTEALQTRRTCKAENEILEPIYNLIFASSFFDKMEDAMQKTTEAKERARNRVYGCKTSVLDDFRESTDKTAG